MDLNCTFIAKFGQCLSTSYQQDGKVPHDRSSEDALSNALL